jgi:hypothetical protein
VITWERSIFQRRSVLNMEYRGSLTSSKSQTANANTRNLSVI